MRPTSPESENTKVTPAYMGSAIERVTVGDHVLRFLKSLP